MRLIDLLNQLEETGALGKLYKAGAATLAVYAQREVYNTYQAFLASPHYADKKGLAAAATAEACRVGRRTVYRACASMEQEV